MKLLFLLLTILMPTCLLSQTNYPPNTSPYTNYPVNWVYDCNFHGYNNFAPGSPALPCGYYDEPVVTNRYQPTVFPPIDPSSMHLTTIVPTLRLEVDTFGLHGPPVTNFYSDVEVGYTNVCIGSNYNIYESSPYYAHSWPSNFTFVGTFTPTAHYGTFVIERRPPVEFIRISGFPYVAPPHISTADFTAAVNDVLLDSGIGDSFGAGLTYGALVVSGCFVFTLLRTVNADSHNEEM